MTNLEKLIQVIGETFPGTKFDEEEIKEYFSPCTFLDCKRCTMQRECDTNGQYNFWNSIYIPPNLKVEKTHTGYMVMVDDDGKIISYSGCIHPSYSNAMEEVDNAEYHGWNAHIKSVEFVMKGGEWKNA